MAYSPIEQSRLARNAEAHEFAGRHGLTPTQAALAWLLAKDDVIGHPQDRSPATACGRTWPPSSGRP